MQRQISTYVSEVAKADGRATLRNGQFIPPSGNLSWSRKYLVWARNV